MQRVQRRMSRGSGDVSIFLNVEMWMDCMGWWISQRCGRRGRRRCCRVSGCRPPGDVLHLVVDDNWCDVVLFLEDFGCLGGEGCGGVGTGDSDNGCWGNK